MLYLCFFQNTEILSSTVRERGGILEQHEIHCSLFGPALQGFHADQNLWARPPSRAFLPKGCWPWERFLCAQYPALRDSGRKTPSSFKVTARIAPSCVFFFFLFTYTWLYLGLKILEIYTFPKLRSVKAFWIRVQNKSVTRPEFRFSTLVC